MYLASLKDEHSVVYFIVLATKDSFQRSPLLFIIK